MTPKSTSTTLGILGLAYLASAWFAPLAVFPAFGLFALSAAVRGVEG